MAYRLLGKIDFTDSSRVPAPSPHYHNADTVEFLEFFEQSARAAGTYHDTIVDLGGGDRFLLTETAYPDTISGVAYSSQGFFKSKKPVPQYFTLEANIKFLTNYLMSGSIICLFDSDYDTLDYKVQAFQFGAAGFGKIGLWSNGATNNLYWAVRDITLKALTTGYETFAFDPAYYTKIVMFCRDNGVGCALFRDTGEMIKTFKFFNKESIYRFEAQHHLALNAFTYAGGHQNMRVKDLYLNSYNDLDYVGEAACGVTTDVPPEQIVGAPDAKTAITDTAESSYISLASGTMQIIDIDLTGATSDLPLFEVSVITDSTDAAPIFISFATNAMGTAWTEAIQLGDTEAKRWTGEKLATTNTYSKRSVFYPEIGYLLSLDLNLPVGCRKIRLQNQSYVTTVKVFKVSAVASNMEIIQGEDGTPDCIAPNIFIERTDVPLGSAGATHTGYIQNTSDKTFIVFVTVLDTGVDGDTGAFQWSHNGTDWRDAASAEFNWGTLVPGDTLPFYVRSNLGTTGEIYKALKAKIQLRCTIPA